jgi:hypothetical protein
MTPTFNGSEGSPVFTSCQLSAQRLGRAFQLEMFVTVRAIEVLASSVCSARSQRVAATRTSKICLYPRLCNDSRDL